MKHVYSAVIIGGGAAAIAAARALKAAGHSTILLEARSYLGGRAQTDNSFLNFPLELGAEFIHGDFVVTRDLVDKAGLSAIPVERYPNLWWSAGSGSPAAHWSTLPDHLRSTITNLLNDKHDLADFQLPADDMSLAEYLRRRGRSEAEVAVGDVLLAQTCCATAEQLSCDDLQREMRGYEAGEGEARVREGYGSLWSWMCEGLESRLDSPVTAVQWGEAGVEVEIAGGEKLHGRTCIITASVAALQRGMIRFQPPLSAAKEHAIARLRMEPATKLVYHFDRQLWPDDLTFLCHEGLAARWWTPAYNRPGADAVITAYITAERARTLDAMSEADALQHGLGELSGLLGLDLSTARAALVKARRICWAHEPYVWGGYAHCPVGMAGERLALARPEGGVLFFAGEATAQHSNPQTVHGALDSGTRVAQEVLQALRECNPSNP